ncbi:FACT complex subunit SPT16 N-terminal lobe domain-containing protein [Mycena haematopus]|nr:FACT complex subunit SPT16 N-terminal lobe domain-containing protein [Mycena haematopus]
MSTIELDKLAFHSRVQRLYKSFRSAAQNDDYSTVVGTDALFLLAGDPEDGPERQGTLIQRWLLGYEFPSTFILCEAHQILILCSSSKGDGVRPAHCIVLRRFSAKILAQLEGSSGGIPIRIFTFLPSMRPRSASVFCGRSIVVCSSTNGTSSLPMPHGHPNL